MGNVNQKQAGIAAATTGGYGMHPTTKANNRILSIALAVCLVLGLTLVAPGPVAVQAADVAMQEGKPAITVDATVIAFGGHEWIVIGHNGNGVYSSSNTATLLLKGGDSGGGFPDSKFREMKETSQGAGWKEYKGKWYAGNFTEPNDYNDSTLQQAMESAAAEMTTGEENLVVRRTLTQSGDGIGENDAEDQLYWPLSASELIYSHSFDAPWWLRSPNSDNVMIANTSGSYDSTAHVDDSRAVRPAFQLKLTSILFTSTAGGTGAKSQTDVDDGLVEASVPSGTETIKFTMLDSSIGKPSLVYDETTAGSDSLRFSYADATTGNNQYLSCVLVQGNTVKYYGKLADCATQDSGEFAIDTSTLAAGTYTLKVFCEQANEDLHTDFAGTSENMTLTISGSNGTITDFDGETATTPEITTDPSDQSAIVGDTATFTMAATGGALSYQWQVSTDGGSTWADVNSGTSGDTASYNTPATTMSMNGHQYRAVVKNIVAQKTSDAATLTVNPTTAQQYSITIDSMANGSVAVKDGLTRAEQGAEIHLIVTPDHGYRLQSGTLRYNSTPITGTRFTMPGEDVTIYARFEPVPSTPSVSVDSLTIPKGETRDFVVYLGTGGDAADSATVTSNDPSVAAVNPDTVTADGTTVTVTGVQKGNTAISLGWSGGSQDNMAGTVSVEVTDGSGGGDPGPGDSTHRVTVTANPSNGGNPVATPTDATPTQIVTVKANPHAGWEFAGWSSNPSVAFDDDLSPNTTFAMPDGAVTITASYTKSGEGGDPGPTDPENPGGGSSGSRSTSRDRSSGNRSTPDRQAAKTTLPASAFKWEGRNLTIDHDSVSVLGLLSVQWDGKALTRGTDYGVYSGSVIIRFGEDFIAAQPPGDHTVRVEFLNHTGETTVTVGETGMTTGEANDDLFMGDTHNPNTGGYPDGGYSGTDNPNTGDGRGVWLALLLGSMVAAALMKLRPRLEVK